MRLTSAGFGNAHLRAHGKLPRRDVMAVVTGKLIESPEPPARYAVADFRDLVARSAITIEGRRPRRHAVSARSRLVHRHVIELGFPAGVLRKRRWRRD
jgi:hypothetical protein